MAEEYSEDLGSESYEDQGDYQDSEGYDTQDSEQDSRLGDGSGRGDPGLTNRELDDLRRENYRLQERARVLDDFEQNPEKVLRDAATRLGLDLVPRSQQSGSRQGEQPGEAPTAEFMNRLRSKLGPEMDFMADALGEALWDVTQSTLKPIREQQTSERMRSHQMERDAIVAEMDSQAPGWRDSLGEMEGLFNFIRDAANGGTMKHPKYGSLQNMLYRLVSNDRGATRNAATRMRSAAQMGASSISNGQSSPGLDIEKQMNNAKSRQDRFKIAFRQALKEHGVR
jgi:hypothetical protein